jgi:hypothetical protein
VSKLQAKKQSVVKLSGEPGSFVATAKGGSALTEAFASRTRLWSDARKLLPARRDPRQGFTCEAWLCALVHGLLAGGRGFSATEPMRGDEPLLAIIGLASAPSSETVEEVAKYLAHDGVGGHGALSAVLERQSVRLLGMEKREGLLFHGFVPVLADGTLIDTEGKTKDALVRVKGAWGQMACAAFIGPYLAACDFSRPVEPQANGGARSEGELLVTRGRILPAAGRVLEETRLAAKALFLMDSLYGEDGTLCVLEQIKDARHIVGANRLELTAEVLCEQPESQWKDTTARTLSRGWEESAACVAWIQCGDWEKKRTLVGRRHRKAGEMIWNYSGVITNLDEKDPRVAAMMEAMKLPFAEAVWLLYDHKQGMENRWKELLRDMGLHAMPCGKAAVNAVFLAAAAIALNTKTGCARLCLGQAAMALWRFRRDVIDLAAKVARHARQVIVRLLDARAPLVRELDVGFAKLAAL